MALKKIFAVLIIIAAVALLVALILNDDRHTGSPVTKVTSLVSTALAEEGNGEAFVCITISWTELDLDQDKDGFLSLADHKKIGEYLRQYAKDHKLKDVQWNLKTSATKGGEFESWLVRPLAKATTVLKIGIVETTE